MNFDETREEIARQSLRASDKTEELFDSNDQKVEITDLKSIIRDTNVRFSIEQLNSSEFETIEKMSPDVKIIFLKISE